MVLITPNSGAAEVISPICIHNSRAHAWKRRRKSKYIYTHTHTHTPVVY